MAVVQHPHAGRAAWLLALACLGSACLSDITPGGDGITGDPSEMEMAPGAYEGFRLEACPRDDQAWLIIGTGSAFYLDVGPRMPEPERRAALSAMRDEVLAPIYSELRSVAWSDVWGLPCRADLPPVPSVAISSWSEVDGLIVKTGLSLGLLDLAEVVEVRIEPPIAAQ